MKKAQAMIEYIIFLLLAVMICLAISRIWNRKAIINGGTFGVEVKNQVEGRTQVHVKPMTE